MRALSLCTGYGGLDTAIAAVLGGAPALVADIDPGACALLAHRFPGVPNIGDVKTADWASLGTVDILGGGYPCQPFSQAGRRLGVADPRHLWPHFVTAIGILRPPLVVLENVHGHLTLGFDTVLADLAGLGYDAEWVVVTASAAGACHRRARLFILAFPAQARAVAGAPVAVIRDSAWLEPCESLFGAVPFTGRIPASGSMAAGRIRAIDDGPAAMTAGLLKTPTAQLAINGGSQHPDKRKAGGHGPTLADQVEHELLPTPTAADGDRASAAYERGNPTLLGALLPTPTSAVSGRTPEQHMTMRESIGRTTPSQLEAAARLLPTPNATDSQGGARAVPEARTHRGQDHGPRLRDVAPVLLPTPSAADGTGGHKTRGGDREDEPLLGGIGMLLPTPSAGNFNDGEDLTSWEARRQRNLAKGINGNGQGTPLPVAVQQLAGAVDWGPYEAAIRRWEGVTGRPAPRPTVPGKTGERLNAALPEWMMGLPSGWITEVPGLSRNAMLKLAGNGVVVQQGALALRLLLSRIQVKAAAA